MKQLQLITLSILCFLTLGFANRQVTDNIATSQTITTIHTNTKATTSDTNTLNDEDDFSPGLGLLVLLGICFIFLCIGAGIVLTVFILLILFGLISLGILSASILVGLNKKSFATGFKTFLVSCSSIGGLIIFGAMFWLLNKFTHWWTAKTAILIGVSMGCLAGFLFGLVVFFVLQKLTTFLKSKLNFGL